MFEQIEKGPVPMKKKFKVQFKQDSTPLIFSSMFDSGNIQNGSVLITPGNDCSGSSYESHARGWFYFSIKGGQNHTKLKVVIKKMTQLSSQIKNSEYFKPVYRYDKEDWNRVQTARTITKEDDTQLHIDFEFTKSVTVYFAYTYPFSYEQCEKFLQRVQHDAKKTKSLYYNDEVLIHSPEGRRVHLLTLSSNESITEEEESLKTSYLFPESKKGCIKFSQQKKVVIISARVHPSETPSNHTFNGLLKFLLSKDARAFYLRKYFVFKLIPMLNPDGVANGHHRMDVYGQNLNRFYQDPDPLLHPSAFSVKQIGQYYYQQNKLCFYIDLHAHPQKKGNFIYGNAMGSSQAQVQTQLFAKILSLNSIQFDYSNSSFDSKHMTLKDRNEDLTKEGCGRVVFQKQFNVPYSYTMQCGYTCSTFLNEIVQIDKAHRKFDKHSIVTDEMDNLKSTYYAGGKKCVNFTIQAYESLGRNIAVSILDLFGMNPASRIPNTSYQNLDGIRKQIAIQLKSGQTSYFVRKYVGKPFSQQLIKPSSQQSKGSRTINSFVSLNQKQPIDTATSVDKKSILASSQFVFLQSKAFSEKMTQKQSPKVEVSANDRKGGRKSTLPKVNLFKLNAMQKNVKMFPKT